MWLSHPINPSNYKIVRRFDLIVAIAKVMRGCHFYYVSASDRCLYGITEGGVTIREVKFPLNMEITTSFLFRLDTIDKDILSTYIDFAILDDMPWALLPLIKYEEFNNYTPLFMPVSAYKLWTIVDKRSKVEVDYLDLYGVDGTKAIKLREVQDLLKSFFRSRRFLSPNQYTFTNMQRDFTIQDIFTSKAAMGEKYVKLQYNNLKYEFFLFKNAFTFNKNDTLDIGIRDRLDCENLFEASFIVTHDKNPIKFVIDGDFREITYATFVKM